MIGMRVPFTQILHGALQGRSLVVGAILKPPVEARHEVCRATVVDVPQSEEKRMGARVEKAPN